MVWWLWPVVGVAIGYVVSTRTGLSRLKCMVSGIVLGPLNAFLLFTPVTLVERGPGKCSYCAETVLMDARVCQHCGAILGSA